MERVPGKQQLSCSGPSEAFKIFLGYISIRFKTYRQQLLRLWKVMHHSGQALLSRNGVGVPR